MLNEIGIAFQGFDEAWREPCEVKTLMTISLQKEASTSFQGFGVAWQNIHAMCSQNPTSKECGLHVKK